MDEEIMQINRLNDRIQHNVAARERAKRARRHAAREARFEKAVEACRVPLLTAAATIAAAALGLATADLATLVSVPVLFWVFYQAGTVR